MRTVSFSDAKVQNALADNFLCTLTNTQGLDSTGKSFSHSPQEPPGPCGRGAGRQNVQTIFLTPEGKMFHVATGFLSPNDLLEEIRFASRTFNTLKSNSNPVQTLVAAQSARMRTMGFSESDLQRQDLFQDLTTGFSPSDLGIQSPVSNMFGDVAKKRVLRDTKYVVGRPLIHRDQFEANPSELVGQHPSFFGSNAAMNMLGGNMGSSTKL